MTLQAPTPKIGGLRGMPLRAKFSYWYVRTHPRRMPKLEAFVLLPIGASMGRSERQVQRHFETNRDFRFSHEYTIAEVETLAMMGDIPILDFSDYDSIVDLQPDQGYRDGNGVPIDLQEFVIVAGTVQKARSAALDP